MSKIILVENHLAAGAHYLAALRSVGHEVRLAQSGEEALTLSAAQRPELIVAIDGMPMVERVPLVDLLNATPKLHNLRMLILTVNHTTNGQPGATQLFRRLYDDQLAPEQVTATVADILAKAPPEIHQEAVAVPTVPATPADEALPIPVPRPPETEFPT